MSDLDTEWTADEADPPALTASAEAAGRDVWRLPRLLWHFVTGVFTQLFAEAVRGGRVRLRGRPNGTATVHAVVVVLYTGAVGTILFAETLRRNAALAITPDDTGRTTVVPRTILWLTVVMLLVCVALFLAGAMRAGGWFRAVAAVVATVVVCSIAATRIGTTHWGLVIAAATLVAIAGFTAVRRRAAAQPSWEVAALVLLTVPAGLWAMLQARHVSLTFGADYLPLLVQLVMQPALQLVLVPAIIGGAGVADFALTAADWLAEFARTNLSRAGVAGLFLLLAGWRIWTSAQDMVDQLSQAGGRWAGGQVGAVALVIVLALSWLMIDRIADRRSRGTTEVTEVRGAFQSVRAPVAVALVASIAVTVIGLIAVTVGTSFDRAEWGAEWNRWWHWLTRTAGVRGQRIALGLVLIGAAWLLARRARRGVAELSATIGIVLLANLATSRGAIAAALPFTPRQIDRVGLLVTLALGVRWLVTRRLTQVRIERLLLVLILTALLDQRSFITDPIGRLIGFAGIGFILFGFVWSFLTGGQWANGDSRHFPRDSRLLIFYAQSLFGVSLLAYVAVSRNTVLTDTSAAYGRLGDEVIGLPLLLTACCALLVAAIREQPWPSPSS